MIDLYLRAGTEAQLDTVLAGLTGALIDRIGIIRLVTGYVGMEATYETLPGYHANVRLMSEPTPEQLADLDGVTIAPPANPFRVWA